VFDTIAGKRRVLALNIVHVGQGPPRVVYGVETVASALDSIFRKLVETPGLLPDALVKGPLDSTQIRVRLRSPDGVALFAYGTPPVRDGLSTDTVVTGANTVLADVELNPSLASALLIGGLPETGVPISSALLGLFALGVVVAVAAVYQLNRGRELARLRARFIANVSHELRTPLAQISMFAETLMLSRERSVSERLQFASIIHREARRLSHLVETVLRFSAADARQPRLQLERVNLGEFVEGVVETFQPLARAADTQLVIETVDDAYASIDCAAMQQVVVNLLDNALKHGGPGKSVSIVVAIATERSEVLLHIEDEGPGVPAAERARIFEPFVRVQTAGARRVPGAGIGLAVVNAIVAAHGGRVSVDQGKRGARFTVWLPLVGAMGEVETRLSPAAVETVATP
jgi:signal transduction histidine kinase